MKQYLILLVFLLGSSLHAMASENNQIRIGTNLWPGYEPLYLAQTYAGWPKDNVRLIRYPSSSEVIRAFRNKSIEAAGLTLDEVLTLEESGIGLKIILVMDVSNGADAILSKSHINTFEKLRGKRIVVEGSALGAYMLTRALNLNEMAIADVEIYNAEINQHEDLYLSDDTDAIVTFDPVRSSLVNKGAYELFSSKNIPGEIVDVLVVRNDLVQKKGATLQAILKQWFLALADIKANKKDALELVSSNLSMSRSDVELSYKNILLPTLAQNRSMLTDNNMGNTIARLSAVMIDAGLLMNKVNTDRLITNVVLERMDQ